MVRNDYMFARKGEEEVKERERYEIRTENETIIF
jgi:hypothetical protein